jgi:hypothetical protein
MVLVIGIVISAVVGAAVAWAAPRVAGDTYRITRFEFAAGLAICALVVVPVTAHIGNKVAVSNNLSFDEYWNGWETAATRTDIACERDGRCRHTYRCDPYTVTVTKTRSVPDGNGGTRSETYTDTEQRWRDCPYTDVEHTYVIDTTLERYTVAEHRLPDNPEQHRWRDSKPVPDSLEARVGVGAPAEWTAARERIDAGDPGPVTAVRSYDNYILASQYTTLRKQSGSIERYHDLGLLPEPAAGLTGRYRADKTHLIDVNGDEDGWSDAVDRAGAQLGSERQGDLHLVAVDATQVDDPDRYTQALMASWLSPERGDQALSKNGVVAVLGVDDGTVAWARLDTGMPSGNEALATEVRNELTGTEFSPDAILGHSTIDTPGDGALTRLLFAEDGGFERQCMVCDDADDAGLGFSFLSGEIRPTGAQTAVIVAVMSLLAAVIWAAFAAFAVGPTHRRRGPGDAAPRRSGRPPTR